jgi:protoheme IX farnesyltransferase
MTSLVLIGADRRADLFRLGKPRVVALIVFCALIGMLLAVPDVSQWRLMMAASIGIGLVATGAAAANCVFERKRDALMVRTHLRPLPQGTLSWQVAASYAVFCAALGLLILALFVNLLTMYLTLATFFAYSVVYTQWLKPRTPQNIVIGGAAGAMPPVLGWAAMSNAVPPEAAVLFLIIYAWTPPHFWALALYRLDDYRRAGLPMLPVTHGAPFTRLAIWLYSWILAATTLLPVALGFSSWFYLSVVLLLNFQFLARAWQLYRQPSDDLAKALFRYSINYLAWLFTALLVDHYAQAIQPWF